MDEQTMKVFLNQIIRTMESFEEAIKVLLNQYEEPPLIPAIAGETVITVEVIRNLLMEKVRDGKTEKVREIFGVFGIDKLSDLKSEHYDEVYQMVQNI